MVANFPTSLDALSNPTSTDGLNNPSHSGQHADANDAIEALEAKVGINGSAVSTSLDYLVTQANAIGSSGLVSGIYYTTFSNSNTMSQATRTTNQVTYSPFLVDRTQSFDRIAIKSSSTLTGNVTVRLGIYNNSNKNPSTVVLDAGTVVASAATVVYSITINQSLSPGWYWLAAVVQATTGVSSLRGIQDISAFYQGALSSTLASFEASPAQTGVSGAFATASPNSTTAQPIMVALRAV
jgi:hypothetical protein